MTTMASKPLTEKRRRRPQKDPRQRLRDFVTFLKSQDPVALAGVDVPGAIADCVRAQNVLHGFVAAYLREMKKWRLQ